MKDKKTEENPEASSSAEVRQLMDLLRTLARTMGFSNAALARRGDVSLASLVRYFKGDAEPRLEFVLAVVRAIGLDVREFFEMAYPERAEPTAARQRIETILGPIRPGRILESPPPKTPEPHPGAPGSARRRRPRGPSRRPPRSVARTSRGCWKTSAATAARSWRSKPPARP